MKQQETLSPTPTKNSFNGLTVDEIGDMHLSTGLQTPMVEDAFKLSDQEKKEEISYYFKKIMEVMGLDLKDDSLQGTPDRVAKMYIEELFFWLRS